MIWLKRAASPATLIAVLALIAAVVGTAIAAPKQSNTAKTAKRALKLAQKNQKRINKIQLTPGPQGLQGEPGLQGLQGPPGPTFAAVSVGAEPAANPDGGVFPIIAEVDTPAPGRLLVMYSGASHLEVGCSAGTPNIGLYVDGDPVPGTGRSLETSGVQPAGEAAVGIFGVTSAAVSAGKHELAVLADCPTGELTSTGASGFSLGAILLGQ